jgi:hypothetical protein
MGRCISTSRDIEYFYGLNTGRGWPIWRGLPRILEILRLGSNRRRHAHRPERDAGHESDPASGVTDQPPALARGGV